jgi:hypothetical protein
MEHSSSSGLKNYKFHKVCKNRFIPGLRSKLNRLRGALLKGANTAQATTEEAARLKLKFDEYAGVVSVSIKEDLLPQFREILSLVKAEHVGIEWGGKVEVGKRKVGELNEEVELVLTDDESDSDEEGEVEEELSDQ